MPNCKFCGEPVVVTPIDHPECRRKKMEDLAANVCTYSCKWNTICDDKDRLRSVHCSICGLPKLIGGV